MQFKKVAIIGVGLLGGSIGLALKQNKLAKQVVGLGRNKNRLDRAIRKKAIDVYFLEPDWEYGLRDVELVILCTPVCDIVRIAKLISKWLPAESVITDVGSTKHSIVQQLDTYFKQQQKKIFFVGSHPMAGSDQTGVDAAKPDLYKNAVCLVTPTRYTAKHGLEKVSQLWKAIGGKVIFFSPEVHDRYVAAISHLPHLVAASLVNAVAELNKQDKTLIQLAAGGFKDTTRIASSSPEIWRDICLENQKSILQVLRLFEKEIRLMKEAVANADSKKIYDSFVQAKQTRDQI
ncbi:MAG: prephenate dehydrogenase [bacterium]|nr:prephenate dehydrogenase [bacterium]